MTNDEPSAYVIGWQPFLGLKIHLDSRPLIPRPETEWWTEQLLTHVGRRTSNMNFLDLCAGSGAVGCAALAKLPNAKVYFGEVDQVHEATILKNVRENNLDETRADIRIGDLFEPFADIQFDVIACNPPYIPNDRELPASVADYEPSRALRSGADGLDLIHRIAAELPNHLTDSGTACHPTNHVGGVAWIECDSLTAEAARALFQEQNLVAEIHTDQYGEPRVLVVSYN